eukprot:GHRQ01017183.1.p3 GENE.GHRQ01017183.1~~GHRQ01017183.1.p3  ORF type:complete len:120 (-),score=40.73 GHRQ01017183.1:1391-1750(-)
MQAVIHHFDAQVKLAISYALAQSTKLSLHERRVTQMVVETKYLPESLAATGKVALSPETIAKLIGKVRRRLPCISPGVLLHLASVVCCVLHVRELLHLCDPCQPATACSWGVTSTSGCL